MMTTMQDGNTDSYSTDTEDFTDGCGNGADTNMKVLSNKTRKWKTCVYILSAVTMCVLLVLLGLTVYLRQSLLPKQHKLCVPCGNVQFDQDDEDGAFEKIYDKENNGKICCGNTSEILTRLVVQNVKQQYHQYHEYHASRCQHKMKVKPSASVFGLSEHRGRRTGNLVHWNINSPNSFQRGVHYGRGFLEIKQSGFYYIFSQVKFRSHPRDSVFVPVSFNPDISRDYKTDSDDDMTHRHYMLVLSQSSETERILLESYKSTCGISDVREFTSAVGAVFYLNKNDKLLVRTSHPQHLVACNHTNNFGVYMI